MPFISLGALASGIHPFEPARPKRLDRMGWDVWNTLAGWLGKGSDMHVALLSASHSLVRGYE